MNKLFISLILTVSLQSEAADMKLAKFANQCSSLFLLMTFPSDEELKPFTDNISNLSETMAMITASIYELNGKNITYIKLRDMRNIEADNIIERRKKNKQSALDLYARCDQLREDFAYTAMQEDDDKKIINALSVPGYKAMNDQKSYLINYVLDSAIAEMENAGISSIVELYNNL